MTSHEEIWSQVKANRKKLRGCPKHRVDPTGYVFGRKLTCLECQGEIQAHELSSYIEGYVAAGGAADDIWPGYRESKS